MLGAETTLAPLLVLLAASVLVTQLRRLAVLARRPYLETRRTSAADLLACICYAALAASHAGWLIYWAVVHGPPFELFFEACLLAVWAAAEVRRLREVPPPVFWCWLVHNRTWDYCQSLGVLSVFSECVLGAGCGGGGLHATRHAAAKNPNVACAGAPLLVPHAVLVRWLSHKLALLLTSQFSHILLCGLLLSCMSKLAHLQVAYAWAVYTHALMLAGRWGERPPVARALLITSALQLGALVAAAVTECLRAPSAGEAAVLKQALLSGGSSGAVPAEALSTDPRRKRQRPWRAPLAGAPLKEPSTTMLSSSSVRVAHHAIAAAPRRAVPGAAGRLAPAQPGYLCSVIVYCC